MTCAQQGWVLLQPVPPSLIATGGKTGTAGRPGQRTAAAQHSTAQRAAAEKEQHLQQPRSTTSSLLVQHCSAARLQLGAPVVVFLPTRTTPLAPWPSTLPITYLPSRRGFTHVTSTSSRRWVLLPALLPLPSCLPALLTECRGGDFGLRCRLLSGQAATCAQKGCPSCL